MSFTPRNRSRPFSYNSFRSVGNKRPSINNDPNYNPFSDGYIYTKMSQSSRSIKSPVLYENRYCNQDEFDIVALGGRKRNGVPTNDVFNNIIDDITDQNSGDNPPAYSNFQPPSYSEATNVI